MQTKYQIIYADPPWDYKGQKQTGKHKTSGGAADHYPTVKLKDLKQMDVPSLCDEGLGFQVGNRRVCLGQAEGQSRLLYDEPSRTMSYREEGQDTPA